MKRIATMPAPLVVLSFLAAAGTGVTPPGVRAENAEAGQRPEFEEAIREYQAALECPTRDSRLERFQRAELLFARVVAEMTRGSYASNRTCSPDLLVNAGNAALGAEHLGPAVLAYRRALTLDPDHRRARQNLQHARSLLPEWVPRPQESGWLDTFFAWNTRLSSAERRSLAAVMFVTAAGLLAASLRWRRAALRNLAIVPALVWLLLLGSEILNDFRGPPTAAVVTATEVVARAADAINAPARWNQPLPGGTEVDVREQREGWSRIRLADGREAWVPASAVELVAIPVGHGTAANTTASMPAQ